MSPLSDPPRRPSVRLDGIDLARPREAGPQPRWRDGVDWEGAGRGRSAWVVPLLCFVAGVLVGLLHGGA